MHFAVLMIVGGLVGGLVSGNKGRNILGWTIACGVMPLLVVVLFALPALPQPGVSRVCPHCLRIIPWQASMCAYCRQPVGEPVGAPCAYCGSTVWDHERACPKCGKSRA